MYISIRQFFQRKNKSKIIKVRTLFLVWVRLFLNGLWGHDYFGCRSLAAVSLNNFTQVFDDVWCLCSVIKKSMDPATGPPSKRNTVWMSSFLRFHFQFWGCSYWRALILLLCKGSRIILWHVMISWSTSNDQISGKLAPVGVWSWD